VLVASLASTVLDYLRVLAWPAVVAAFLGLFFLRYRDNIGRLIDRVVSVKVPGATLDLQPTQTQHEVDDAVAETLIDEQFELVEGVRAEYVRRLAEEQVQQTELTNYLLTELATKELQVDFERIYRIIWGSQIAALRSLRAAPAGLPRTPIEAHLSQAKQTTIEILRPKATFEEWFSFLESTDLATASPDGLYRIKPKGVGFLTYIEGLAYPPRLF
jgi:hypothetical protein